MLRKLLCRLGFHQAGWYDESHMEWWPDRRGFWETCLHCTARRRRTYYFPWYTPATGKWEATDA